MLNFLKTIHDFASTNLTWLKDWTHWENKWLNLMNWFPCIWKRRIARNWFKITFRKWQCSTTIHTCDATTSNPKMSSACFYQFVVKEREAKNSGRTILFWFVDFLRFLKTWPWKIWRVLRKKIRKTWTRMFSPFFIAFSNAIGTFTRTDFDGFPITNKKSADWFHFSLMGKWIKIYSYFTIIFFIILTRRGAINHLFSFSQEVA